MKIQNISDVDKFFKVIDECKGTVELVSPEGDRINLKSKLTQYLSMATIFSNGYIKELDLVAHDREDIERLIKYMYQGEQNRTQTGVQTVLFKTAAGPHGSAAVFCWMQWAACAACGRLSTPRSVPRLRPSAPSFAPDGRAQPPAEGRRARNTGG